MDNSSEDCYSSSADESLCDYLQTDHKDTEVYHRLAWVFDREQESESAYFRYITRFLADMDSQTKRHGKILRQRRVECYKRQLISKSTVHGLKNCFDKKSKVRRIIWTIFLMTALGLLLQKLYESTVNYMSHPFSTMKTMRFEDSMQFPAVSICNLNDMRASVMNGTKLDRILKGNTNLTLEGNEYRNTIRKANHRLEDMLYRCKILGNDCHVNDFIQFNNDQGDSCFTYNHGTRGQSILFFNRTGPQHSLELTINIEAYEYDELNIYSGIHLILHGQDETPVKMQGVMLSPEFITYIAVKKKKLKNLPHPFKSNCGSKYLRYFNGRYSKHLCWLETLTDHVIKECGCKEWFMPGPHRVCSLIESKQCMWPSWSRFNKFRMYDCPLPCVMDSYVPSLSLSQFKLDDEADKIAAQLNATGTAEAKKTLLRGTFLKAIIYYGELSYEYMEQVPTYDKLDFLADIGGQLGLFLGSSAITYMEFIDCIVMIIYTKYFTSQR